MPPAARPQWQQATAVLTLGASGVVTGLSLVPKAPADLTSPASLPIRLMALERSTGPAPGSDAMLRAAVVHVARHFLNLAQTRSPAEMEALIWRYASTDGADHGPSCAAFASLTLELGSQLAGHQSWATGGTSYPWAVHPWVDGRVDPNPASPGIVSVLQDAQAHGRWHPLGDGYAPRPGDWVLFDGHVEVVTKDVGGVLYTIGGDSMPNLSVNAHEYAGPLQDQGVAGFVDNGLSGPAPARPGHGAGAPKTGGRAPAASTPKTGGPARAASAPTAGGPARAAGAAKERGAAHHGPAAAGPRPGRVLAPRAYPVPTPRYGPQSRALPALGARPGPQPGHAAAAAAPAAAPADQAAWVVSHQVRPEPRQRVSLIPGTGGRFAARPVSHPAHRPAQPRAGRADVPATGMRPAPARRAAAGEAAIPGLFKRAHHHRPGAAALAPYRRQQVVPAAAVPATAVQRAFIREVAQGAMATQRRYGVPASVTIAQAIDESAWGQSALAVNDHNLFGIKGTGPAGSDVQPTQEVIGGQVIATSAPFRIYQNVAQSIDAHARLLAGSSYYTAAMSQRHDPNAFAVALTGVYATDPTYGAKLVQLMQQYDLYRYDHLAAAGPGSAAGHSRPRAAHVPDQDGTSRPGALWVPGRAPAPAGQAGLEHPSSSGIAAPFPRLGPIWAPGRATAPTRPTGSAQPSRAGVRTSSPRPAPIWAPGQAPPAGHPDIPHSPAGAPRTPAHTEVARRAAPVARAQPVQPDPVANPAPAPYPGRSPRPAPLRHPARPADPASAPGMARAAAAGTVRQPGPGLPRAAQPPAHPWPANRAAGRTEHRGAPAGHGAAASGAAIPGLAAPGAVAAAPGPAGGGPGAPPAGAAIPGAGYPAAGAHGRRAASARATPAAQGKAATAAAASNIPGAWQPGAAAAAATGQPRSMPDGAAAIPATLSAAAGQRATLGAAAGNPATLGAAATHATLTAYHAHMPPAVREAFVTSARMPLLRAEPLYADVASHAGIRWEILAACDWMQCKARRGVSPVYGEKLGVRNADGTCYRTKSAALERCAYDLVQLARQVYHLDIATSQELSVRDLANAFAAYRWGGLLRQHSTSALDFPYSVAGLTADHTHMRWPNIDAPEAPDKPGSRFRGQFGAVPVVLGLNYQALA